MVVQCVVLLLVYITLGVPTTIRLLLTCVLDWKCPKVHTTIHTKALNTVVLSWSKELHNNSNILRVSTCGS